jgi:hypothetical protein
VDSARRTDRGCGAAAADDFVRGAIRHEGAATGGGSDVALERELLIDLSHGVARDPEFIGEQARRRHLGAGGQLTRQDGLLQQAMELAVDRLTVAAVEALGQPV